MTKRVVSTAARLQLVTGRLMRMIRRHGAAGLSASQISALATIEEWGPLRMSSLATHESLVAPAATRLVAGLEERTLIRRCADPADGRAALVSLTPEGSATLAALRRARAVGIEERLATLTASEREVLEQALPILERLAQS
ncbi:MAG: MarR family transcriptional regulator [Acidimicrobiales bacterium]